MSKSTTSFRQKCWEVIYPGAITLQHVRDTLFSNNKSQYIHECFVATHTGKSTHTHCGISLGKTPNYTAKSCYKGFTIGDIVPNKCRPLEIGKGVQGKLDFYYRYCMNQAKHPSETLSSPACYKFIHKTEEDYEQSKAKSLIKLSKSAIILKAYVEDKLSLYDQYEAGDWNVKANIAANYEKLNGMLISHQRMVNENKPPEFPMSSFIESEVKNKVVNHDFFKREKGEKKRCLVLTGASNLGKTKLAKARFKKPLVVRHMDKLKAFDPLRHDGIIFDDMSFSHYPRECVLALMDMDDDADINVKNSMITIPAGFPRIFCTNRQMYAITSDGLYDKAMSFLPYPLASENRPRFPVFDLSANGANGVNSLEDKALTNRFILVKVSTKLYA